MSRRPSRFAYLCTPLALAFSCFLISATLALTFSYTSHAMINPAEFQKTPEKATVKILAKSVKVAKIAGDKTGSAKNLQDVTIVSLAAEVLAVDHTVTNMKKGEVILITFIQNHSKVAEKEKEQADRRKKGGPGWVGPQVLSYPNIPEVGSVQIAHLEPASPDPSDGRTYTAGAYQYSFEAQIGYIPTDGLGAACK